MAGERQTENMTSGYNPTVETETMIVTHTTIAGIARAAWQRTLAAIRALPEAYNPKP